jgi:hypothetical protein
MHTGAGLGEQRGELHRALTAADDDDLSAVEAVEVVVRRRVRHQARRQSVVARGSIHVVGEADRHDDGRAANLASVCQREQKPIVLAFDRHDVGLVDRGYDPLLEPQTVVDERLDRHRVARRVRGPVVPGCPEEGLEAVPPPGVGEIRGPPVRSQRHAFRHVVAPEFERLAEDGDVQTSSEQMGRRRESVRTCADDDGVIVGDRLRPPWRGDLWCDDHAGCLLQRVRVRLRIVPAVRPRTVPSVRRVKSAVALTAGSGSLQSK